MQAAPALSRGAAISASEPGASASPERASARRNAVRSDSGDAPVAESETGHPHRLPLHCTIG